MKPRGRQSSARTTPAYDFPAAFEPYRDSEKEALSRRRLRSSPSRLKSLVKASLRLVVAGRQIER